MKTIKSITLLYALSFAIGLTSCSNDNEESNNVVDSNVIRFNVEHPAALTRATDTSFESGDKVGIFLTDQNKAVELAGNYVTNIPLTFQNARWTTSRPLYWNEGTYDVYAYYPYMSPLVSVTDQPFSVATDQNDGVGFEASDLLWTAKKGLTANSGTVNLQFAHRLSRMQLQLVKSDDYEGELPDDAEVYVHNTVVDGTLDMNAGMVTCERHASAKTIKARSLGNHCYAAIVIPQRLNNRVPLVEVVSHGVSYLYESRFLFKPGVQHNVQLVLSNNPDRVKIQIGGEIQNWN
jgi:hypothetical protein